MTSDKRVHLVLDSCAVISYFGEFFMGPNTLSSKARMLIEQGFSNDSSVRITIPSLVIVEIYEKWLVTVDKLDFFRKYIFELIMESPNVEIRPLDSETIETFLQIDDGAVNLECHDRLILAVAVLLDGHIVTSDGEIDTYVKKRRVTRGVL